MLKSKKAVPDQPEGFDVELGPALAAIKEALKHPLPHRGTPHKRGALVWQDESIDPETRDAWRPVLGHEDMGKLSPEGRLKVEIERLGKIAHTRTDRGRRWLDSLAKADLVLLVAWVKQTERDRQSGAKSRLGPSKRANAEDKKNYQDIVRRLGPPPTNTAASLLDHTELRKYNAYHSTTRRRWIAELDARPVEKRSGRPRKPH